MRYLEQTVLLPKGVYSKFTRTIKNYNNTRFRSNRDYNKLMKAVT